MPSLTSRSICDCMTPFGRCSKQQRTGMARYHGLLAAYIASAATYSACLLAPASATEPPAPGVQWPSIDIAERFQSFTTRRGFINLTRTVVANRIALSSGIIKAEEASAKGGTMISGRKSIPVLLLKFSDTVAEPYPVADLQKKRFARWPSGTMTDFYRELSYGQFTVDGTVYPWTVNCPYESSR